MKQKTILVDAVFAFVDEQGVIDTKLQALLDEYPNRKIIVTNADYEKTNAYKLCDMPYEVFTLKHEPNKTDPLYFNTLLMHFNFDNDDAVYFEHDPEAVASAKSAGIRTYHYESDEKDLVALKEFLDAALAE